MAGLIAIITQRKAPSFTRLTTMVCILYSGAVLFFSLLLAGKKLFLTPPPLRLCCSPPGPGVAQPAPHHPTWPPHAGAAQPTWRTAVPDRGLYFGGDGAHPAGFYRHVSVEESPAEQHAQ